MRPETCKAIGQKLSDYYHLVEIGIGNRPHLASFLSDAGHDVMATDIKSRSVPPEISFEIDDILDPTHELYEGADAFYALNLPAELQRPASRLANRFDIDFHFTTLGWEIPVITTTKSRLPAGYLYTATSDGRMPFEPFWNPESSRSHSKP